MPLPTSGPLYLSDIADEFDAPQTGIELTDFYAGGAYVPSGSTGVNGAIPSSGPIDISDFYGARKTFIQTLTMKAGRVLLTNNWDKYGFNDDPADPSGARRGSILSGSGALGIDSLDITKITTDYTNQNGLTGLIVEVALASGPIVQNYLESIAINGTWRDGAYTRTFLTSDPACVFNGFYPATNFLGYRGGWRWNIPSGDRMVATAQYTGNNYTVNFVCGA